MKKKSINTFRKEQIQMLADYLLENFSGEMGNVGWRNKERGNETMKEFPKIQTIYRRDERGTLLEGQYAIPEFEYLKDNNWVFTEKVDGTNARIMWQWFEEEGEWKAKMRFGGKTDNAQMHTFLYDKLVAVFSVPELFIRTFVEKNGETIKEPMDVCLYGEGYGARIQRGGGNYIKDGVDFILIDVKVDEWWLKREDVEDIANKMNLKVVPIVGNGTLQDAVEMAREGFDSRWGDFIAEGIVLRPRIDLMRRNGERIIAKIKHKDFKGGEGRGGELRKQAQTASTV